MQPVARSSIIAAAFIAACLAAPPLSAECAGFSTVDNCLIGAWRQSGGGPSEWMKRNMPPGMPVPQVEQSTQVMVLGRDGRYRSAPTGGKTSVRVQGAGGAQHMAGTMEVKTSGRWSAQAGRLHLCPESESVKGEMQVVGPDGSKHAIPIAPSPSAGGPMSLDYSCSGDRMETRMAMPGMDDPMTTQYARTEAGGR